ncbi:MAG: MinD/ParA family protein [Desulfovibrio sp.]|jgi:flagellar biosynthesis protein FlhG|nr:MinD/ParA family protein [Desulfovibrio sp.]
MNTNTTISFCVISGKGGVGKSNLALNLCYGLHQLGNTVLLMDSDMGLANLDVLLGISPDRDFQDIFLENRAPEEILLPIGPAGSEGFDLLPANSGAAAFVELEQDTREIMCDKLNPLADRYSFFALDVGAGISSSALGFSVMTTLRFVVVTPEPTSLTDSYALMKVLASAHGINDFFILVNQAENRTEAKLTYSRLSSVCQRFLGFQPGYLGGIRTDKAVPDAVRRQRPFLQLSPQSPASRDCMDIAAKICDLRAQMLAAESVPAPLCQGVFSRVPSGK